ncbi:MAG: carboxypeptidase regulatory-like domain-containing protein, partial [Acidobacteriota bacterium]|nr:carboxypeptidase regulatory-like domain-containing protein [Acidobacteriota bacterium]
ADHDAYIADGANIDVSPGGPTDLTITLQWPNVPPLQVRSLGGQMLAPSYYPNESQIPLSLSLLEAVSGRVIATIHSDDQGHFSFPDTVPTGLYFIRLNPSDLRASDGEQIKGMIGVAFNPKAGSKELDGYLGWSDCGLGFAQRVPRPPMTVAAVCGDILDSMGAAIGNARVLLLDDKRRGAVLADASSNSSGKFALPGIAAGTYRLLITYPGFAPFLLEIHLKPDGNARTCRDPMHIQL